LKYPCKYKYDGVHGHNGEYWWSCGTCGASDWVGHSSDEFTEGEPMRDCVGVPEFEVGDRVYHVKITNNAFSRQKLKMVDSDGVEWYRYDKPIREYDIEEATVIGIVRYQVEGILADDTALSTETAIEYSLEFDRSGYQMTTDEYYNDDEIYPSLEAAEARMKELQNADFQGQ
jgi:hypothetical protein